MRKFVSFSFLIAAIMCEMENVQKIMYLAKARYTKRFLF